MELVRSMNDSPWDKPYKVVLKMLRGSPATKNMKHSSVRNIASVLFLS